MKILLIEPQKANVSIGGEDVFIFEPLSLEYLAAGISDDHDVKILDMRLDNVTICLDAAHIKWFQAGGPDHEENGLSLCSLHHRLFDRGAFTVDKNLSIAVSQSVSGSTGVEEILLRYHKKPIQEPQSLIYTPNPIYTDWHIKEVFRKPARD